MTTETTSVAIFTRAALMLAEADTIQKAKDLKSLALTAADWARRKGMGEDAIKHCRSFAIRAEIKMGEMLLATKPKRAKGGQPYQRRSTRAADAQVAPSLSDIGITRKDSSRAQALAELSEREQEEIIEETLTLADVKRKARAKRMKQAVKDAVAKTTPSVTLAKAQDWLKDNGPFDLLLTDPPYSTDVEDLTGFVEDWLPLALSRVKPTGRAYICIGAYPGELLTYLSTALPKQVLVWTYRNTLGPSPTNDYKQNWQAILYYEGPEVAALNCERMTEQFSVQDINAPDGRLGDRFHVWQKPLELGERFVRHATKPGDLVGDPFCGTGTFLLAASMLGRRAVGCDVSDENLSIAVERGCVRDE